MKIQNKDTFAITIKRKKNFKNITKDVQKI